MGGPVDKENKGGLTSIDLQIITLRCRTIEIGGRKPESSQLEDLTFRGNEIWVAAPASSCKSSRIHEQWPLSNPTFQGSNEGILSKGYKSDL